MKDNKYFADRESKETASVVLQKAHHWFHGLETNGYIDKLRDSWSAYHGAYYQDAASGHKISFSGEQGEIVNLPVNHFRNIAKHILVMTTSTRPAMEARATNTDYKSLVQTKLANGLLDYYLREKRLENYLHRAIEYAIVLGSGYIKMEWNATSGETYDFNEETNTPIYEGDIQFMNLSPFDVVFDSTKEDSSQHDWVLCRSFKNRFDLAAKYPDMREEILSMETKDKQQLFTLDSPYYDQTDDIAVYEFYHRRTESMPDGRYMLFVGPSAVLLDSPMPYRDLPVYRVSPSDILGTPYGYTDLFDILPIQDALNSLYSAVLTNQNAFAVQNVLVPRGVDIDPSLIGGAMNIIEYNQQMGKPEPLQLTHTPKETFDFIKMLEQVAETLSGVNSVSRGNPEASLKSGNALALVQSMALQFISGLQQSYVKLIEDVGTGLINTLKDYAAVPRVAMIVGESNRTYLKEFTGDDLSNVNRVIVDMGNPLSKTTAGRAEMASQLLQMGVITNPEQYISVMNTGKLENMTDSVDRQLLLIKAENEKLLSGEQVNAVATEKHSLHIKNHSDILADPDLKNDPDLVARTLSHIQEHVDLLRTTDPDLLALNGEQPLAPPGGMPINPMNPEQMPQNAVPQGNVQQLPPEAIPMNNPAEQAGVNLPQPAQPPAPFENLPTNASDVILE